MRDSFDKVYLVIEGRHDYSARAVFSTPELAEQYIAAHMTTDDGSKDRDDYDILEFELNQDIVVRRVFQAEMTFAKDTTPTLCTDGGEGGETQIVPETFEWRRVSYWYYHKDQLKYGPSCRAQALSAERAIELVAEAYDEWVRYGRPMTDGQGMPD
jgi:hypothetical protein